MSITQTSQSIGLGSDITKTYGDSSVSVSATGYLGSGVITYQSSNTQVATIDTSGNITIHKVGTTTLSTTIAADVNYTSATSSMVLTITKKPLTITANNKTKTYGASDPTLTYSTTGIINGDTLTGSLTRVSGESVGTYAITQGTLNNANNNNYDISFTAATLSITKANQANITITDITKILTDTNFTPTYSGGSGTGNLTLTNSSNTAVAIISSNQVDIVGIGTAVIGAYKAGDTQYNDSNTTYFTLTVSTNDPLSQYQWHIKNTEQSTFSGSAGVLGVDLNIEQVIGDNITGKNVVVAVVDTGLEIAHEDLSANVVANGSYDFVDSDTDPTNSSGTTGDHGTSVAGIIAATMANNKGGTGIAPDAQLKEFNYLRSQNTSNWVSALGGGTYSNSVFIFNQSYSNNNIDDDVVNTTVEAQLLDGVTNLRGGKGAIYTKSAGNGFKKFSSVDCSSSSYSSYLIHNLTCQNANMDPYNTLPYNIVTAAVNANGKKSSYSTAGSSIWISGFGGEYGTTSPAILTTDQSGCSQGYARAGNSNSNSFEDGDSPHSENPNCNYTSTFNGTSSAAPTISGIIALMLEKNPNLTWRDIKYILATTAKKIDASISPIKFTIDGTMYQAEPTWITNNAGYNFHNYYGFGLTDGKAAVDMAGTYTSTLGSFTTTAWIDSGTIDLTIPDASATGVVHTLNNADNITIEAVQIKVNLTHTYTGDIAVELTSPNGTKSVLLTTENGFLFTDDLTNMVMLSNAFYGENSTGNWQIRVLDSSDDTAALGVLNNWSIRFFGDNP